MKKFLLNFILLISLGAVSGLAQSQITLNSVANRIQNMSKLINESSGAKQVMASDNVQANKKRDQAVELYDRALAKLADGDADAATGYLDEAARLMFDAMKLTTPTSMAVDKQKVDYDNRLESVTALKDAFNRIADESRDKEAKKKVNKQLDDLIARADDAITRGNNSEAQAEIDKAYHLLKVSIESKRAGQTLVRSLQFETKEEEYHYEIDRNDTHNMLISLLVDDKKKSKYAQDQIMKFVAEAEQLRKQADAYAGEDAFEIAIDLLEQSTKQLVRAIRSAGIYIPG
jgi:hypothetical protein